MTTPKKIWIDLDNSPHVPFFLPIIEELQRRKYAVLITARDAFQVCELADAGGLRYQRVGRHSGKNKLLKVGGLAFRTAQLINIVRKERPSLAVSHGSRAQLMASALTHVPSVLLMDYEYARGLAIGKPTWAMVPESIAAEKVPVASQRVLKYPGIKEDVYVPQFRPDPSIRRQLGITETELLVTIRPPANEAHYHNPESDRMFAAVLHTLRRAQNVKVVLLPRNQKQGAAIQKEWADLFDSRQMMIPEHALDGLNLIWFSDLVISGGGTMNREAAALGVPVYSIFRGKIGAVDRYLSSQGRLVLLESIEDVRTKLSLERRSSRTAPHLHRSRTLDVIVEHIAAIADGRSPHVQGQTSDHPEDASVGIC